ncbi:MAG: potassium-transporting ATPase subunit F [Thermoplasmata archaeon]|nr:potassium-transporting ATPase subunit F [Thermoplasmata archaeon]
MDVLSFLLQHLGVLLFSVIAIALVAYLIYSMLHPESF